MQSSAQRRPLTVALLQLLFPSSCPSCCAPTDTIAEAPFCARCWDSLRISEGPSCRVCAEPLPSKHADICAECITRPPAFSRIHAFGLYDGILAAAIHEFKFKGIRRLKNPLSRLLLQLNAGNADAVTAVPSGQAALRSRGFNQSLLLAAAVARVRGIPLLMDCLRKTGDTLPQVGLPAAARSRNLRGKFIAGTRCRDKRILLVDDVVTTGATVRECASALKKAGARDVIVLALARAASV